MDFCASRKFAHSLKARWDIGSECSSVSSRLCPPRLKALLPACSLAILFGLSTDRTEPRTEAEGILFLGQQRLFPSLSKKEFEPRLSLWLPWGQLVRFKPGRTLMAEPDIAAAEEEKGEM